VTVKQAIRRNRNTRGFVYGDARGDIVRCFWSPGEALQDFCDASQH
jgi:hypothetical protein